ncbi:DNA-binding protein [Actinotignum sp. GS-2025b]|uniref:helix-turn-helix domain-containing transcriptional regulator n=1 Tax=unclassified Actinotignum TaxID=2632702 RepID=UPI00373F4198
MAVKITRWDATDYLETWEDVAAYLNAVLEERDPKLLEVALKDVVRALARRTPAPASPEED